MEKIQKLIEDRLGRPEEIKGIDHNYLCPFCKASHLHVAYVKDSALCHKCEWKTRSLLFLVQALYGHIPRGLERKTVDGFMDVVNRLFDEDQDTTKEAIKPALPKGYRPVLPRSSSASNNRVLEYFTETRKVPIQTVLDCGIGYVVGTEYIGYAVIPVFLGGELVYYTTRNVIGMTPKTIHPKIPKDKILFNMDRVLSGVYEDSEFSRMVALVEGPFDVWGCDRIHLPSVAVFGHSISIEQAALLDASGVEEIVLMFDPDVTNAWSIAEKLNKKTSTTVSVAKLKSGDPAEVKVVELYQTIDNRMEVGFLPEI